MALKYRVLVLDLDGTLTNSKKEVTEDTKQALAEFQQQGGIIVLASGRPTYGIVPVAKQLELEQRGGYILAFNGGHIMDCKTGKCVYRQSLPKNMIHELYDLSRDMDTHILTYQGADVITEHPDDPYVQKEAAINHMPVKHVDDFVAHVDFPVTKCLMVGEPDYMAVVEKKVQQRVQDRISAYRSEPFFLELVPTGIDKASCMQVLMNKLGLTAADAMACGDGYNDLTMLRWAGLGVAMANAQPEVREQADVVTLSNDEDGVAAAIRTYALV